MMQRLKRCVGGDRWIGRQHNSAEPDHDEIIGLARNIERMAQALQRPRPATAHR
jgi:hypothetical protein